MALERPALSISGAPKREEKILGSNAQKPTNPVHRTLPVVDRIYQGNKICINWLVNEENASVVKISLSGVLGEFIVNNFILNSFQNYIKW